MGLGVKGSEIRQPINGPREGGSTGPRAASVEGHHWPTSRLAKTEAMTGQDLANGQGQDWPRLDTHQTDQDWTPTKLPSEPMGQDWTPLNLPSESQERCVGECPTTCNNMGLANTANIGPSLDTHQTALRASGKASLWVSNNRPTTANAQQRPTAQQRPDGGCPTTANNGPNNGQVGGCPTTA